MEKSFKQFKQTRHNFLLRKNLIGQKVKGQEEKPFAEKKEEKEKLSDELDLYREEGQKMIDSYRRFFITFARDISLGFKMSNAFYIDLENGIVNLDTKWFAEKGFSKEQILWANLHELSHFRDLAQDPKRMMENFDYLTKQAKKTGAIMMKKWEDKYSATDPELIERLKRQRPISKKDPNKTMNAVEQAAYKIHHTFYNVFDDIYVNNLVARKAPKFEEGTKGGEEIKKLYQKKLFPKTDYSKLPRHLQFVYKLIREEMVKDEEVTVNKEVQEVMKQKIKFQGKEYSPKQIVECFIKPKGSRDTKAGQRYFVLQNTLEPIFEKLLMKDLDDWEPEKPPEGKGKGKPQDGEGSANPFDQDYQEYEQNNPDQMNEQDVKDWLDKHQADKKKQKEQEAKKEEEESKSAEDKAKEAQEKMDKEWCEKHNLDYGTLRQFRKIEAEVEPYLAELSRLWQRIIFGSTKKIERGIEGYYKTGVELDIPRVIEEWPKIAKGGLEKTRVMKRMTQKEVLIRKPELIRVRLIGDMSGSMDEEKKHILQQCFVLMLSSLREFNTYLNLTRSQTKSKLEVDTEAWIFGDDAKRIKRLRSESGDNDEQIEIVKIFKQLRNTIGMTYDDKPLKAVLDSLLPEDKEKIKEGKIMEILFEITDGGSSNKAEAKKAVNSLVEAGVITRAFQIGSVDEDEKEIFDEVWNRGEEKLGERLGTKIKNLLPAMTELLKKYLNNVRL